MQKELGGDVDIRRVEERLKEHIARIFAMELEAAGSNV